MIISRTPFRVGFFGGGSDYPTWWKEHGGEVLGAAIDKYCYISCRELPPFFDYKYRLVYSRQELVNRIEDIQHPSIRECLKFIGIKAGLEVHHDADLPAQTGLGTSSAFTVGFLNILHTLKGDKPLADDLASEATHVEQDMIKEHVGCQDQILTAHGSLNHIEFKPNATYCRRIQPPPEFLFYLMLVFTGFTHQASIIAEEQIRQMPEKQRELATMQGMVKQAIQLLGNADYHAFGKLLDESWQLKRTLSGKISTPFIDYLYEKAKQSGAIGGKLLGAGGGGFLLLLAEPDKHASIKKAMGNPLVVPFKFDTEGSRIILNNHD